MTWRLVARKDVRDAIRQYHLHASVLLFAILFGGTAYVTTNARYPAQTDPLAIPVALTGLGMFLVPLLAVAFSQGDVVGMRTRGDLKLLLGMPVSRRDVVLGSFAGRTAVVWASIVAGVVLATLVALLRGAPVAFDTLLAVTGLIGVLGVIFVSIAIAASAAVSSETRSGALAMGAFFLFVFRLWGQVPRVLLYVLNGFEGSRTTPEWVKFVTHLNPVHAFQNALQPVLPEFANFLGSVPDPVPVYRSVPFAVLLLALWVVVPVALGYRRFDGTDL